MRKESVKIAQAFIEGRSAKAARTYTDGNGLYLHGHQIAQWDVTEHARGKRVLHMNCCGWPSVTTKDRLNTLLTLLDIRGGYFTRNHQLYFGSILRPVGSHETITIDLDLALELANENTITPKQIAA